MLTPRRLFIDEFLKAFWNSCSCAKLCPSRVSVLKTLETYQLYSDMSNNERSISLGAIIDNVESISIDSRNKGLRRTFN